MAEGLVLQEQRNLTRRELIYYLRIADRRTDQEVGRLGDIHAAGMLVLSEKPLRPGDVFDATVELPKAMQTPGQSCVALRFEALWHRPGPKNSTYHESGARFMETDETQQALIGQLIEAYAMPGR